MSSLEIGGSGAVGAAKKVMNDFFWQIEIHFIRFLKNAECLPGPNPAWAEPHFVIFEDWDLHWSQMCEGNMS